MSSVIKIKVNKLFNVKDIELVFNNDLNILVVPQPAQSRLNLSFHGHPPIGRKSITINVLTSNAILIIFFCVSIDRYISAKKQNKEFPGTYSDTEIKKRKIKRNSVEVYFYRIFTLFL